LFAYDSVTQALAAMEKGELNAVALDNTPAPILILHGGGKLKAAGDVFAARGVAITACKQNP
jgi:ABC-type amino acid transport substrate-binding protein